MTDADLIKLMDSPPPELEPVVAMFRNLRASIQQKDVEVAVANEAFRVARSRREALRLERAKMAAQADALSAALRVTGARLKAAAVHPEAS